MIFVLIYYLHIFGVVFKYHVVILLLMSEHTKKELWGQLINVIVAVLSAIATTLGLNSCMGF